MNDALQGWVSPASGPSLPVVTTNTYLYAATETGALSTVYRNGVQLYSNGNGNNGFNGLQANGFGGLNELSDCQVLY